MLETLRRRIVGVVLILGFIFTVGLVWVATLPPPISQQDRETLAAKAADLNDQNDPVGAADAYRKLVAADPSPANRKGLARALLRAGTTAEALTLLESARDEAADEEWNWLLSRAHLQSGDVPAARAAMDRAGAYRSEHPIEPEPGPYVGASKCASCHKGNHDAQQASAHARTFARDEGLGDLPLPDGPVVDEFDAGVTHRLTHGAEGITLETRAGDELFTAVARYAFGSGDRGMTLVGKDSGGGDRELRLSRYAPPHGWQVTSGQTGKPGRIPDFVGRPLSPAELRGCFGCHTTQPDAAIGRTGPTADDRAIGCEQCHGPGSNHLLAVEAKLPDVAIARAHAGPGGGVQELCARCHSPRELSSMGADPLDAVMSRVSNDDVRFQSVTLARSRCFTESQGKLDCLACHSPHRDAETDPAFYEAKCLQCHTAGRMGTRTVCPISPARGCVDCHMPAVSTAVPHSTFTDHHIKVHPEKASPPLLRRPD